MREAGKIRGRPESARHVSRARAPRPSGRMDQEGEAVQERGRGPRRASAGEPQRPTKAQDPSTQAAAA